MNATTLDLNAHYKVAGWPAVAVYVAGYPKGFDPVTYLGEDDDGNECEIESGEFEEYDDTECGDVMVVMVGDDRKHRVSIDDLIPIDDLDYCAECGQIGCCHDGRDREIDTAQSELTALLSLAKGE